MRVTAWRAQAFLQAICLLWCTAVASGWSLDLFRVASPPPQLLPPQMEESVHARVLRLIYTAAAATLVAQIVLNKRSGSTSTSHKGSSDKDLTWREDRGVSKLVPLYPDSASSAASKAERLSRSPAKRRPSATADARTETSKSTSALPRYTQAAVAKHCTREDCWVIIEERVYDVTRFVDRHPGGVGPVVNLAGKDATEIGRASCRERV